nr:hypothetical protein [Tanacetum cinerariifolium]
MLVIPVGIISNIHQLIGGFLWCNGEYKRGRAKVAWEDICLPKKEGGLGLRSLELQGRTIWDIQPKGDMSWGWCSLCPLIRYLSPRDITREEYTFQAREADLLVNGAWNWPQAWLSKAPNIGTISTPNLSDTRHDHLGCRDASGNLLCSLV